jgi:MFS family permease
LTTSRLGAAQNRLLIGLLLGILVVGIDSTIVATILSGILLDLGHVELAPWVFAAYMLLQISTAPIFGKLSDRYGRKRVFLAGLALFLAGSELIAFSHSIGLLVAARAIQGAGAGAIFPAALATIFLAFPPESRARLQGAFSATYGISNVLGPVLGAVIGAKLGWRYAFHVNILFVSGSAYLVWRYFQDLPLRSSRARLDIAGAAALAATVAVFSIAVMELGSAQGRLASGAGQSLLWIAVPILAMAFLGAERRAADPVIPGYFFQHKGLAILGNALTGALMYSFIFFLPLSVQAVLGGSPGGGLLPLTFSQVLGSVLGARLVDRTDARTAVGGAAALVVLGATLATRLDVGLPTAVATLASVLAGVGVGALVICMVLTMQMGTPPQHMGVSSSLSQASRNLGGILGVNVFSALHGSLFRASLPDDPRVLAWRGRPGGGKELAAALFGHDAAVLPRPVADLLRSAYARASGRVFMACAVLGVMVLLLSRRLPRGSTR